MRKTKEIVPIHSDFILDIPDVLRVPEFIKFIMWFATPRQFRDQQTQKEFAEAIGVCEDTLTDWKRHPSFWPLVQEALAGWMKERIPDVVGSLYERASAEGKSNEVKMFLQLAERAINSDKNK